MSILTGLRKVGSFIVAATAKEQINIGICIEGKYTPTFSSFSGNISNVDTPTVFHYQKIGTFVDVLGEAQVDQTGGGEGFFHVSLPFASNFTNEGDCSGIVGISDAGAKPTGYFLANVSNNVAQASIETTTANSNRIIVMHFKYKVQ